LKATCSRRGFLAGASALCLTASASRALPDAPRLVSVAHIGTRDGGALWSAGRLTPFGLPARGHAPVQLPDGRVLVMGRRPGLFATIVDPRDPAAPPQTFAPAGNNRFAGHACVSPDGTALMTSEFDAQSFQGALVSRDPATGVERARWPLGGIEPHEIVFTRDGSRIVVALGGLIVDGGVAGPAFNPDGIDSAVLEVDPLSGRVLARRKLVQASLSLRHLAADGKTIVVAAQDQDVSLTRPLLAKVDEALEPLAWPDPRECDFRSYRLGRHRSQRRLHRGRQSARRRARAVVGIGRAMAGRIGDCRRLRGDRGHGRILGQFRSRSDREDRSGSVGPEHRSALACGCGFRQSSFGAVLISFLLLSFPAEHREAMQGEGNPGGENERVFSHLDPLPSREALLRARRG
jgi:hypothetical protein